MLKKGSEVGNVGCSNEPQRSSNACSVEVGPCYWCMLQSGENMCVVRESVSVVVDATRCVCVSDGNKQPPVGASILEE